MAAFSAIPQIHSYSLAISGHSFRATVQTDKKAKWFFCRIEILIITVNNLHYEANVYIYQMKKVLLFFCFCVLAFSSFSQWYDPDKVNKKASALFNLAYTRAQNGEFDRAITLLNDAVKIDPRFVDAYLSLGGVHGEMKKYEDAVKDFEQAMQLDSVYSKYYLLPYSIDLAGAGRFDDALRSINRFLEIPDLNPRSRKSGEFRKKTFEFAVSMEKKSDKNYVFAPVNLGDSINTVNLEYFPALTIDGKKLFFTRRIGNNEDLYESTNENGVWRKAIPLPGNINTPNFNEGAEIISQDGKWLLFTGCNFPGGFGSCDLYISYLTRTGWSRPENLGRNVNSEYWESTPSLSPDKRDLYFSSNMPGGYGGKDIWVCHRDYNGNWSEPENLGPDINTAGDESTPFIHADNQTLYFNSTGHPGYSDEPDIFVSHKLPGGKWSTPQNLGYPVNTIDDEGSLFIAADGHTAFYSSDRADSKGGLDIYTFQLPQDVRPLQTLWVKGNVFDKKTNEGLPSAVILTDLKTGDTVSRIQTDEDGEFLVTLPVGKDYAFTVKRKGYLFFSANYDVSKTLPDETFTARIGLQPIEINASVILKNIFFDTRKTDLKPESVSDLNNVISLMNENPTMKVEIIGYTDSIGTVADNLKLSQGRAMSVVNFLISKGISRDRLKYTGKGKADPIADNSTEEGRALNRRTELKVIGK